MKYLPDVLLISGAGLLSYGAWCIYPPAGYMTAGVLLLIQGIKQARA